MRLFGNGKEHAEAGVSIQPDSSPMSEVTADTPFYNVALSNRWRLKVGATFFGGTREGFLGQYRDSSHLNLQLRYTF